MFIMTEETPNPAVVKFLPGQTVIDRGVAEFKTKEEGTRSLLAQRLFDLDGVESVFYGKDFISVTKGDAADWEALKPRVLATVMEHFTTGQPLFHGGVVDEPAQDIEEDEISAQIRELIETRVRPMVAQDGGDIIFNRFEDGIAYLEMRGACAGCPSSTMTLKAGIENMLKHYVPEVQEVRPVEQY
ncbi:MAG: NifU family protein [Pseudomonadota bacterium]